MSDWRRGKARVYLSGHPEGKSFHPGYRGDIRADVLGVHLNPECEMLVVDSEGATCEWEPIGHHFDGTITVPWARIDSIEWANTDLFARKEQS